MTAAAALLALAAAAPASAQGLLHSNREMFRIPFAASAADLAAAGATEARLLVSEDGGRHWEEAGSAAPGEGGFRYSAPADGDYWFSVITVDAEGMPAPAEVMIVPQLQVRVDRVSPTVELSAAASGDGTVAVRWRIADPAADLRTLAVTFTPAGGAAQRVPVAPALTGSFRIPADRAAGTVTVSVADAAGNAGSATRRTTPAGAAPVSYARSAGGFGPPARQAAAQVRTAAPPSPTGSLPGLPTPSERAGFDGGTAAETGSPALKTRSFKIGYAVEGVGSSGVGTVDLYITPDGGRRWYSYGQDADRVSPANVSVPGDGEYGFCVRVRSGAGLAGAPPRPGDAPDVRVTVDGTPPSIEILTASQGHGVEANSLSVSWRLRDDRPAAAPVRVELADAAAGPWEVARDWDADAGAAVLPLRPGRGASGGRVFVRVTARDAAGNEHSAVTPHGVPVDLTRPTARVLGVVR